MDVDSEMVGKQGWILGTNTQFVNREGVSNGY